MDKKSPECPEPEAAAVHGGCPGRDTDPAPTRKFHCDTSDCPLIARLNRDYGTFSSARSLGVRVTLGQVIPFPSPSNDNSPE